MYAPKKKNIPAAVILIFFFLVATGYYKNSYLNYGAFAQSEEAPAKPSVIKLPPPVNVNKGDLSSSKELQTSDIKLLTSKEKMLVFRVELAITEEQKQMGLMFRNTVLPGAGMLFVFDNMQERSFWMKNTWIPLDIIFIGEDGIISNIHHNAIPRSLDHIDSKGEARYVLEIGGGEADRLGIAVGDTIIFD